MLKINLRFVLNKSFMVAIPFPGSDVFGLKYLFRKNKYSMPNYG
jgi:hypothetical protein